MLDPDDDLCVCFHVPLRKVTSFIRLSRPRVASQISECYGAGTGCGWCIPYLEQAFESMRRGEDPPRIGMSRDDYLRGRGERLVRLRAGRERVREALMGLGMEVGAVDGNFLFARGSGVRMLLERLRAGEIGARCNAGEDGVEELQVGVRSESEIDAVLDCLGRRES